VILHGKKRLNKKDKKSDVVTKFWYTLKKSHPFVIDLSHYCNNKIPFPSSQLSLNKSIKKSQMLKVQGF
jgi:hypothetical protein